MSNQSSVFPVPLGPYGAPYVWIWDAHNIILVIMLCLTFLMVLSTPANSVDAAYGRFIKQDKDAGCSLQALGSGAVTIDGRLAWWFMEGPTIYVFMIFYFFVGGSSASGWSWPQYRFNPAPIVMFCIYQSHYVQRTCMYPFLARPGPVSLMIVLASFIFNSLTAYLISNFISDRGIYPVEWLYDPRFILGTILFFLGYYINRRSDFMLTKLRKTKLAKRDKDEETDALLETEEPAVPEEDPPAFQYENPYTKKVYYVPKGFLFEYVSCANYTGEIVIWLGYALLTFSLEGLTLFLLTFGNLVPRAVKYHRFYQEHFPNYPKDRKAVIPFVY